MSRLLNLGLALLIFALPSSHAEDRPLAETINQLLAAVEKSDAKFIRNGDEHSGKDAAAHMRKKYNHFKKEIKTAEDFIDKCANKSEISKKPYLIKTPDGKTTPSRDWMLAKLATLAPKH